jgi:Family of unknown function (DUF6625)
MAACVTRHTVRSPRQENARKADSMTANASLKSIVIIVDYFGAWPEWFPLFLASCRRNPTVRWHMHTDCSIPEDQPPNVEFFPMTFDEYKRRVGDALDLSLGDIDPYKICELRTACGVVFEDEIRAFDYFGYGDLDVIYGDIRHFYDGHVLSHDVISTHEWCTSGHLLLMKNAPALRRAFERVRCWREVFASKRRYRFDEDIFRWVFRTAEQLGVGLPMPGEFEREFNFDDAKARTYVNARGLSSPGEIDIDPALQANNYFKEQFSTPLTPFRWHDGSHRHPEVWFWKDGRVTNALDGTREFLYLHFMNFVKPKALSSRYATAPWSEFRPRIMQIDASDFGGCGVRIDFQGIHPLNVTKV